MTALAMVGRIADGGRDSVNHREGLVRVARCPDSDQDDDYPNGELASESAALAFDSTAGHERFLLSHLSG